MLTFKDKVFNLVQIALITVDEKEQMFVSRLINSLTKSYPMYSDTETIVTNRYSKSKAKKEFDKIRLALIKLIDMSESMSEAECMADQGFAAKYNKLEAEVYGK